LREFLTAKDTKDAKVRAAQAIMKAKKQPRQGAKSTKPLTTDEHDCGQSILKVPTSIGCPMTTRQFALFLCGLIMPMLYQRMKFAFNRLSFQRTPLRKKSGLNIHHGHWGFLLAFISMNLLIFGVYNIYSIGLTGFGWGLMLDEIIPMLKMPSPGRALELEIYDRYRSATFILTGVVTLLALVFFLFRR
jgi:hypothetical protein